MLLMQGRGLAWVHPSADLRVSLQQMASSCGSWEQTSLSEAMQLTLQPFRRLSPWACTVLCWAISNTMACVQIPYSSCLASQSHLCISAGYESQRLAAPEDLLPWLCVLPGHRAGTGVPVRPSLGAHSSIAPGCCCWLFLKGEEHRSILPREGAAAAFKSLIHGDIFSSTVVILLLLWGSNSSHVCHMWGSNSSHVCHLWLSGTQDMYTGV